MQQVALADKISREQGARMLINILGRAGLLNAPAMHNHDAGGHVKRLLLIVSDIHKGNAQLALKLLELLLHILTKL